MIHLKNQNIDEIALHRGVSGSGEAGDGAIMEVFSSVDGIKLGELNGASRAQYEEIAAAAHAKFLEWRMIPAPLRGELVRRIGEVLRREKEAIAQVISCDIGKTIIEARGEVQEAIDIADFAVGLSRQLYGRTMHSERPHHRMYEQWHPMGVVGVITSFNFPVAVWAWNALVAAVCGDTVLWKPSPKALLSAIKIQSVLEEAMTGDKAFCGVFNLCAGSVEEVGEPMLHDSRIPLISATGSTTMGRRVGEVVASRFGKAILELGGNNALIITQNARLEHAVRAALFGAVGTSGQRCTTTRRLIVHSSVKERVTAELIKAYKSLNIGDPLNESTHCGPLVDRDSYEAMMLALRKADEQGGRLLYGGERVLNEKYPNGYYVTPALVEISPQAPVVLTETFAPILYIMEYETLGDALAIQNNVPQGLSSALFSDSIREIEAFLSHEGSDCGIANINIGTSGAEIGGAFGGEKETGGGRESGSDAWKGYMRRQTNTINWGDELPLAQGIDFDVSTE